MRNLLFIFILFIVGCQSVKEGDWYANKGTQKRFKVINIGTGKSLDEVYKRIIKEEVKISKKLRYLLPPEYHYDSADSAKECVSFQETKTIQGPYHCSRIDIVSIEKLKQDYKLVE
jgi:hypothetical protein